jgi:hypothetical protein
MGGPISLIRVAAAWSALVDLDEVTAFVLDKGDTDLTG